VGSGGAEERRKKRELIIFGYKAQEIPPKISFTCPDEKIFHHQVMKVGSSLLPVAYFQVRR